MTRRTTTGRAIAIATLLGSLLLAPPAVSQSPSSSAAGPTPNDPNASPVDAKVSGKAPAIRGAVGTLVDKVKEMGGTVGVAIADVDTGELLGAHAEHKPFNPASNAKILTAAAALALHNPNHRFHTALHGALKGGTVSGLVLRGDGDPSFSTRDLWDMVRELKEAGDKKIDGDISVDQRFFDDQFVPPAFEQQPNEWAYFRAPVAAIPLNENTVTMTVRPG
ncbi:MAG: D-alanyl-D-alanine carboxypeptidase, partial [Polyangiaceae bacterium]